MDSCTVNHTGSAIFPLRDPKRGQFGARQAEAFLFSVFTVTIVTCLSDVIGKDSDFGSGKKTFAEIKS